MLRSGPARLDHGATTGDYHEGDQENEWSQAGSPRASLRRRRRDRGTNPRTSIRNLRAPGRWSGRRALGLAAGGTGAAQRTKRHVTHRRSLKAPRDALTRQGATIGHGRLERTCSGWPWGPAVLKERCRCARVGARGRFGRRRPLQVVCVGYVRIDERPLAWSGQRRSRNTGEMP